MNTSCSGIAACPYDASPASDMKSRVYFGASAATAQSPGPITNEILRRNDFAGYEIFTQVSYQYGGLISPAPFRDSPDARQDARVALNQDLGSAPTDRHRRNGLAHSDHHDANDDGPSQQRERRYDANGAPTGRVIETIEVGGPCEH